MKNCCLEEVGSANLFKALSHPARIAILRALANGDRRCCGDLVSELTLAQSTVSQHIKILKEADLIHDDPKGPRANYTVDAQRLRELLGDLDSLVTALEGAADTSNSERQPAND